jgi:pimeloyl-ACP methyl ester carboxylesterase
MSSQPAAINLRVEGSGHCGLLFVHGFGADLTDWDRQIEDLSRDYRCMALDLPGHGLSALPAQATIEALADAVNAVKAPAPAGLMLVGHSMGCRVVAEAVNRAPEGVIGVILIDGSITGRGDPAAAAERTRQAIARLGADAYLERVFADMVTPASSPEVRAKIGARLAKLDRGFALELALNIARWGATKASAALAQIEAPMLVIQATCFNAAGRRISIGPSEAAAWVAPVTTSLPRAEARVIVSAGHFVMTDAPADTNRMIREFAGRLTRR